MLFQYQDCQEIQVYGHYLIEDSMFRLSLLNNLFDQQKKDEGVLLYTVAMEEIWEIVFDQGQRKRKGEGEVDD